MLTYDLSNIKGPLYQYLYQKIKEDIFSGVLSKGEKIPSKRSLAKNLGISTVTVESAYEQLIAEGYIYTIPKRGYYIAEIEIPQGTAQSLRPFLDIKKVPEPKEVFFDFSSNMTESESFPFSIWTKTMRETLSSKKKELLTVSPCEGVYELRKAIADHLSSFRGMEVDPDQIIVGAGTEYLYSLIIRLLGKDRKYCIENPGYKKLKNIYESNDAKCSFVNLDSGGIKVSELKNSHVDIIHISPTHHFPTGITMPASRRYELLSWAGESDGRYIIEDDYDSEFRLNKKPIPSLQSMDSGEKVIYMNTFSKSLASTIRISYMILPKHLANLFFKKLSFYSCTVSTFEQYTLGDFISKGYFEKHINRMRLYYGRKRKEVLNVLKSFLPAEKCRVIENDSGLHFLLELSTKLSDKTVKEALWKKKIIIRPVTDYYMDDAPGDLHRFLLNYSNMDPQALKKALPKLMECI